MKKEGVEQVIKHAWEEEQTGSKMFKVHKKIAKCRVALLKWRNTFQGNARSMIDNLKNNCNSFKVRSVKTKRISEEN